MRAFRFSPQLRQMIWRASAPILLACLYSSPIQAADAAAVAAADAAKAAAVTVTNSQLQQQVFAADRAFARAMAERKFDQFAFYLADEAIFYGGKDIWRGKEQVLKAWKGFFDEPKAPFSWEPEVVEVLASGTLAHSSGPVKNEKGEQILYYNSIWRQEAPGVWKVVFDKASPLPPAKSK